jgi:hypothetical protein
MKQPAMKRTKEVARKRERCIWSNGRWARFSLLLALVIGMASYGVAQAQDHARRDPLIDILIKKGILTEHEAEDIQEEARTLESQRQKEMVEEIKDKELAEPKALKGLQLGMLAYVDYSNGQSPQPNDEKSNFNRFRLTRGYLTVKKEVLPWLHSRITIDIHQDDTGDYKERLKYLYAELRPPDFASLTSMKSEIGVGHIPWLDFEEHINPYRCQGTMAIERAGTFNSADAGVSLRGDLAGKLEDAQEKTGGHHYDGRYGSWHFGVYNGPGYHASEENENKVLEGRLTLRPLPDVVPGLQLTYFGIYGEGNDKDNFARDWPDYVVNLGMLSYQHPWVTLTGQYFTTDGNAKGTWVDTTGDALCTAGYSFFGKLKLPVLDKKLSLFGRYDHFDQDDDDAIASETDYDMYAGGLAYDIYKGNLLLLAYETTDYGRDAGKKGGVPIQDNRLGDDHKVQAVGQIKF